jgi:hypothetical protein
MHLVAEIAEWPVVYDVSRENPYWSLKSQRKKSDEMIRRVNAHDLRSQ